MTEKEKSIIDHVKGLISFYDKHGLHSSDYIKGKIAAYKEIISIMESNTDDRKM